MAKAARRRGAGRQDVYPNRALFRVIQSAANTLTFAQIRFGTGLFQGTAIIINRIEWTPDWTALDAIAANTDRIEMALTNRDDLADLSPDNMNVLAKEVLYGRAVGTPANFTVLELPAITDFAHLPGGGLIYPANPLFIGCDSNDIAGAVTLDAVMYYQSLDLTDADYIELVQSLIPVNI